ncbi:aldo/keto reductase [Candidatus Bathyarchaeota archaeon]|nr:aldo/keto reductase [Candidatus Bathyarchaeota archaeon]
MKNFNTNISGKTLLGSTDIEVSRLGTGTNRWAYGENDEKVQRLYKALLDKGVNFFDTAEVYTGGKSERLLGECYRKDGRPADLASKYRPQASRRTKKDFTKALDGSLRRLGVDTIDLYYIHNPPSAQSIEDLMDYMAEALTEGKIRSVGVSNFDAEQMRRAATRLEEKGIKLAANQVEYSLQHREPEKNGVLETCNELEVSLVAYRPLVRGQLASVEETKVSRNQLTLESIIESIANEHNGTPSQVALNWLLQKDELVIPIPGTTNMDHAIENAGALDWVLSKAELGELDEASA